MAAQPTTIPPEMVTHVLYDSRKIHAGTGGLFFALNGLNRNGDAFIFDAYEKGVRWFVVSEKGLIPELPNAVFLKVPNPLIALQKLAEHHRQQFTYPVVAITGSVGKTTFKEWAYHILSPSLRVIRSPKSFNSQLGVALSLLELHHDADIALIEAGISEPGEMERLEKMIHPTMGVLTAFGKAHRANFESTEQHLNEKLKLFRHCVLTFVSSSVELSKSELASITGDQPEPITPPAGFTKGYAPMIGLLHRLAMEMEISEQQFEERLQNLPRLALRMEILEGLQGNTIINDTYNLDADALREALHYQQQLAGTRNRIVVIGLSAGNSNQQAELEQIIADFNPNQTIFIAPGDSIPWQQFHNSVVLVKANRERSFELEVNKGKELTHRTVVEIHLSAIRHNLAHFKKHLRPGTKILCMVKASSYGSGAERVAAFLQQENVDYFGVAFADEGVALREAGITKPIVVMNPDPEHTSLITRYELEPAIYSFGQLDHFVTGLIHEGKTGYPVHLKFDTGMHRLGFSPSEKEQVLQAVLSQPEIRIQGVYSHLADADNMENSFTQTQIAAFNELKTFFDLHLEYPYLAHLLNSEGALHYPDAQFDMVRLGIVLYGYAGASLAAEMLPAVRWKSAVSQVKPVPKGDCIGYGCSYEAEKDMTIAVVPVGYADGFRRSLSNGKGRVFIHGKACPVVGRVCMDMIMVDVTGMSVNENDPVEIIGTNQTMEAFAASMETIPYEVMTGLSKRMHRVYVED